MGITKIRRFPRLRVDLPSNITLPLMSGVRYDSTVKELGQGGCLLNTKARLEIGMSLPIRLHLEEEEVWLLGQVLYRRHSSEGEKVYGLKFIDSIADGDLRVGEYVDDRY